MDLKNLADDRPEAAKAPPTATPQDGPAQQEDGGRRWFVIESALLGGEWIVLVLHKKDRKAAREAHPDKVLYFPPEIEDLEQSSAGDPEFIRQAHMLKKEFNGWIVPRGQWKALGIEDRHEGDRHGCGDAKPSPTTQEGKPEAGNEAPGNHRGEGPAPGRPARVPARMGIVPRERVPVSQRNPDSRDRRREGVPDVSEPDVGARQATLFLQSH